MPTTPLMTPDILDISGSNVGNALRVAMHAYHKAARSGFKLMDVANAPLAKRRKMKHCSTESLKENDSADVSINNMLMAVRERNIQCTPTCPSLAPITQRGDNSTSSTTRSQSGNSDFFKVTMSSELYVPPAKTTTPSSEPPPLQPLSELCSSIPLDSTLQAAFQNVLNRHDVTPEASGNNELSSIPATWSRAGQRKPETSSNTSPVFISNPYRHSAISCMPEQSGSALPHSNPKHLPPSWTVTTDTINNNIGAFSWTQSTSSKPGTGRKRPRDANP